MADGCRHKISVWLVARAGDRDWPGYAADNRWTGSPADQCTTTVQIGPTAGNIHNTEQGPFIQVILREGTEALAKAADAPACTGHRVNGDVAGSTGYNILHS